jgi:hypothetical protein
VYSSGIPSGVLLSLGFLLLNGFLIKPTFL